MSNNSKYGYRNLEIYAQAHNLAVRIHKMSLTLAAIERFEEASQIRRSSKSVSAQIVEGYALRKYRDEFLHYLHRALASSDETREHLELLWDTGSLKDKKSYSELAEAYDVLSRRIGSFIVGVEGNHGTPDYIQKARSSRKSKIQNLKSKIQN